MKIKNGLFDKIISFLLVAVLGFIVFFQVITINLKAESLDITTYKVNFENYTDGDLSHFSTEPETVKSGDKSAELTGSGDSNATVYNAIYLVDENGAKIKYREGYTYLIGGYVKAEAGYTGNIRVDMTKDMNWLNWSENTQVSASEEWQFIWIECAVQEGNSASGTNAGLYANELPENKKLYIDDVTVIEMKTADCGAVILNENNNTDVKYLTGKIGDKIELPDKVDSSNTGEIFEKWYSDKNLTTPASDNLTYDHKTHTVYAGFIVNKWTVGYEEGNLYNWKSEREVLKTNNISISSDTAKTGTYSLKLTGTQSGCVASFIIADEIKNNGYATKFAFLDSRKYQVNFWYNVSEASERANGYIGLYPSFTNSLADFSSEMTDSDNRLAISDTDKGKWKHYSVMIETPECDNNLWIGAIRLGWQTSEPNINCVLYIDDIEITKAVDEAPENVSIHNVSFENYTDGDASHISTEDGTVRSGNNSAKLTGSGDSNATVNNAIYLVNKNGDKIKYREGYTYLIGGYVKAEAGYTGNIRVDMTKGLNWLNWSENTQLSATDEWQFIWIECVIQKGNSAIGTNAGLYANEFPKDKKLYIDDVTIIEMKTSEYGAVIINENNNTDIRYLTGKIGDKIELPVDVIPSNSEEVFEKWYTDESLTIPAPENSTFGLQTTMFNAGFTKYIPKKPDIWTIGYEEGGDYNWKSEKDILKTENINVSSEKPKSGSYSLKLKGDKAGEAASFIITDEIDKNGYATKFSFTDSRKYRVSFWYYVSEKAKSSNSYMTLNPSFTNSLIDFSATMTDESKRLVISDNDKGQWKQYSVVIETPEADNNPWVGAIRLCWISDDPNFDSEIYIDDIEIKKVTDIVMNADSADLSKAVIQMLSNEAFAASGSDKQALRFVYYLNSDNVNEVTIDNVKYTVKKMGVLTAIKELIGRAPLTTDSAKKNSNIADDVITDIKYNSDNTKIILSSYVKDIYLRYIDFDVSSRAYIILWSEETNTQIVVYTDVTTVNVRDSLKKTKDNHINGYEKSYNWSCR